MAQGATADGEFFWADRSCTQVLAKVTVSFEFNTDRNKAPLYRICVVWGNTAAYDPASSCSKLWPQRLNAVQIELKCNI